jgi:hypothetical protein
MCRSPDGIRVLISRSACQLRIQLVKLNGRRAKAVERVELASNPLRSPFIREQVHRNPHRQGMVVQDRIQLAALFLVGGVVTSSRKQIAKTEEAAYQRPAARSQKSEALTRPRTSNDGFGFVLENHSLGGDSAHGSARITRQSGVPSHGLPRPSNLLDCRDRHWPAASEAAHVPTLAPPTARPIGCDRFDISPAAGRPHVAVEPGLWMRRHHDQERGC